MFFSLPLRPSIASTCSWIYSVLPFLLHLSFRLSPCLYPSLSLLCYVVCVFVFSNPTVFFLRTLAATCRPDVDTNLLGNIVNLDAATRPDDVVILAKSYMSDRQLSQEPFQVLRGDTTVDVNGPRGALGAKPRDRGNISECSKMRYVLPVYLHSFRGQFLDRFGRGDLATKWCQGALLGNMSGQIPTAWASKPIQKSTPEGF